MAEENGAKKRYSNSSTLSTKSSRLKESTRTDRRKFSRSNLPTEAVSEVAVNLAGTVKDQSTRMKRHSSAPDTAIALELDEAKERFHIHESRRSSSRSSSKQPLSPGDFSPDSLYDRYQTEQAKIAVHYGSPTMPSRPTVHYIGGHVNHGFVDSVGNSQYQQNHNAMTIDRVQVEQYWSWPCCRQRWTWNWTKREKTLSLIIVGQSVIIAGLLVSLLKIVLDNGEIVISKPGALEPPWKFN